MHVSFFRLLSTHVYQVYYFEGKSGGLQTPNQTALRVGLFVRYQDECTVRDSNNPIISISSVFI
jgi:hypothetical protein